MKKLFLAVAIITATLLSSCGSLTKMGGASTAQTSGTKISSTGNSVTDLLGSVVGAFTKTTNENTLVGTWTYKQPAVQFESSNILMKAGGSIAASAASNKIAPYFEKIGIKSGVAKVVLNKDKSCTLSLGGKTFNGTYEYDSSKGTITFSSVGFKLFTSYVSVSGSQLSLTMDSSALLTLFQWYGSMSGSTTISTISSLSKSIDGMKTGFLFTK